MDYWLPIIVLFGAFFFMLALGVPIVYAIGLSTLASISTQLDFNSALSVVSQKLASGLDSFTLLAIPFYLVWQHYEPWRNSATINQLCPYSRRSSARLTCPL